MREAAQLFDESLDFAAQYGARGAQHARIRQVVDVFRGAAEVHEFQHGRRGAARGELLADEVFHRLDVVIDARLDGFHRRRGVIAGFQRQAGGQLAHRFGQRLDEDLRHGFGQRQQPGRFDTHAFADQAAFRQHGAQRIRTLAVAAIDGRKRGQCGGIHEREASDSM